jgi:hypothetical protein
MTSSGVRFYAGFVIGKESGETMRSNRQIAEHEIDQRHPSDITTNFLWVVIPFTTPELTLAALRHAGVCTDLNVHVSLVDIQVVPFSCPMDQPPINREFSEQRLRDLFAQTGLPGTTAVVYTRDWLEGYRQALEATSLVILATKKRWWRTREQKLARALQTAGHRVMLLHQ